jgi:hypothetical protein
MGGAARWQVVWSIAAAMLLASVLVMAAPRRAPTAAQPAHPLRAWRLAFVRDGNIWVANGDGSGQKMIIRDGSAPAWSPDKKQIAFARGGNIWVANADGRKQRRLTLRWKSNTPSPLTST